jgi:hypothetical protein
MNICKDKTVSNISRKPRAESPMYEQIDLVDQKNVHLKSICSHSEILEENCVLKAKMSKAESVVQKLA